MIKAAFFDVDGTLLSYKTKQVCPSAKAAIAALQAKGILCIVATGRHMIQMSKLPVADIPFDGFVMLNGQLVLDKQNLSVIYLSERIAADEIASSVISTLWWF